MDSKELIGMAENDAVTLVTDNGFGCRVVRKDEHIYAITEDFRSDRYNLEVDNGVVTKAELY